MPTVPPKYAQTPPQGQTRLISDPDSVPVYRNVQETDIRTGIARGLKEYVEQVSRVAPGGRLLKFVEVFDTWAEAERKAEYPSAAIIAAAESEYDASSFTPESYETVEGVGLVKVAELKIDMQLVITATDNKQRAGLVAMLETFLTPNDWMYGLRLELPHYYNSRATYEPAMLRYEDSPEDAIRRFRRAVITLRCSSPILRLSSAPFFATGSPSIQVKFPGVDQPSFHPKSRGISRVFTGSAPAADLVPPVVTEFVVPAAHVGTTVPITSLKATDDVGVTGYFVSESATPPSPSDYRWSVNRPTSFVVAGTGTRTLYAFAKDEAGNISDPAQATCVVT